MNTEQGGKRRTAVTVGTAIAALVIAAMSITWAVSTVLSEPEDPLEAKHYVYATVTEGEVSSSLQLNAAATWRPSRAGTNKAVGTVTSVIISPGSEVRQGDAIYTVDLRPVVVAAGETPTFRSITKGMRGADVRQLQHLLADLGHYHGAVDGVAGEATDTAVRRWQKQMGTEPTGTVDAGDLIFVPTLPLRVTLDDAILYRGAALTGGEALLSALPSAPDFTVSVTDSQADNVPPGSVISIASPDGEPWAGVTGDVVKDPDTGILRLPISGADERKVCGDSCDLVPSVGESLFPAIVRLVPETRGLVVPSSAIGATGAGGTFVVDDTGVRIPVKVGASAKGMTVIEGAKPGTRVRLPADSEE